MNKAVQIFGAMPPDMLESFYKNTLLPSIRKDIQEHHKLNVHYYQALKRALFKPGPFFKAIIFELAKEGTAQEAVIVGSILSKVLTLNT
jgi:essential nuclear protein 1